MRSHCYHCPPNTTGGKGGGGSSSNHTYSDGQQHDDSVSVSGDADERNNGDDQLGGRKSSEFSGKQHQQLDLKAPLTRQISLVVIVATVVPRRTEFVSTCEIPSKKLENDYTLSCRIQQDYVLNDASIPSDKGDRGKDLTVNGSNQASEVENRCYTDLQANNKSQLKTLAMNTVATNELDKIVEVKFEDESSEIDQTVQEQDTVILKDEDDSSDSLLAISTSSRLQAFTDPDSESDELIERPVDGCIIGDHLAPDTLSDNVSIKRITSSNEWSRHCRLRHQSAKLNGVQQEQLSKLIKIIRLGDFKRFSELLEQEGEFMGNILNVFVDGQTPLHYSLLYGRSLAWCRQLIMNGANPNLTNRAGWHPVHLAAFSGSRDTMRYLINCIAS